MSHAGGAVALIETMRVETGNQVPLLALHLQRCEFSCRTLRFAWPGRTLVDDIERRASELPSASHHRLRLLLSADGRYSLDATALPVTPAPVRLHLNSGPLDADRQWLRHKTTHRPWYEPAQSWLESNPGYFDIVFFNTRNEMTEGSRCNLYIQEEAAGPWLTPPLSCGLLPGVQRQALLDGGLVQEAVISRDRFARAHAVRISNALRGWLPAELSSAPQPY